MAHAKARHRKEENLLLIRSCRREQAAGNSMKPLSRKPGYDRLLGDLSGLLEQARRTTARAINSVMTAVYWETGRRIVEFEQGGERRAGYGEALLGRLALDLTARFGRGFSRQNLQYMRQFFATFPETWIRQTLSGKSGAAIQTTPSLESSGKISQTVSGESPTPIRQTPPA